MNYYFGKTTEQAIENGLKELGIEKDRAIISIIEEGSKGVLGVGGKKAKVSIEVKENEGERVVKFLDGLFELLKVPATAEITESDDKATVNILSTESASLIGYRGETLDALQTLAGAVYNIGSEEYKRLVVDCENYRGKREETLKTLAVRLANKAIKYGKIVSLEPMNPFERRIIHSALADFEGVTTESQGSEPKRYVVIKPNKISTSKPSREQNRKSSSRQSGFKSEMLKTTKKTSGFGTYLGNSLKD